MEYKPYKKANDYYSEVISKGTDIFHLASLLDRTSRALDKADQEKKELLSEKLLEELEDYFKDYHQPTDEKVFAALLKLYLDEMNPVFLPDGFIEMMDKFSTDKLLEKVYRKSVLVERDKLETMIKNLPKKGLKALKNDPVVKLFRLFYKHHKENVSSSYYSFTDEIGKIQKLYMEGILEMQKDEMLYPDANFTLRVAYGKVEGYYPRDGVYYKHFTTLNGIMQKDNPLIYDYNVPQKLRDIYDQKDFGQYAVNGQIPVCFSASNHTTGGNSGSPVVNANGELIGVNFDRCWEGTMSDIMFDPDHCRNIVLDIRYVLFIVDKLAGAGYLIDEMKLVE